MNKSEFLEHLRDLVGKGLTDEALDFLHDHIKDFAAYFINDVVMLKSRFGLAKSQFLLKGIIGNIEFGLIIAKVNFAILEIANKIDEKSDTFKVQRKGHLLHKIPSKMVIDRETKCIIRIAYLHEHLFIGLTIDEDTAVQVIQVTGLMSVELLDDNEIKTFDIRTSTDEEQFTIHDECTEWIFKVRPLRIGNFSLTLKIGAVEVINGKERKRNIVIEKEIKISVNYLGVDETEFSIISIENENYIDKIKVAKEKREHKLHEKQKLERKIYKKTEAERRRRFEEHLRQQKEAEENEGQHDSTRARAPMFELPDINNSEHAYCEFPNINNSEDHCSRNKPMSRSSNSSAKPMLRSSNSSRFGIILILLILALILFFVFKK